jgi:pimeloyl-ACP methyl ester carboxylesterase
MERSQLLACVAAAGLSVLVATGEHDRLVPPAAVSRIAERFGTVAPHLALLPQCGHLSHEEAPHVLLDFLLAFLTDLTEEQGGRP